MSYSTTIMLFESRYKNPVIGGWTHGKSLGTTTPFDFHPLEVAQYHVVVVVQVEHLHPRKLLSCAARGPQRRQLLDVSVRGAGHAQCAVAVAVVELEPRRRDDELPAVGVLEVNVHLVDAAFFDLIHLFVLWVADDGIVGVGGRRRRRCRLTPLAEPVGGSLHTDTCTAAVKPDVKVGHLTTQIKSIFEHSFENFDV